jgi:hypothetical protein
VLLQKLGKQVALTPAEKEDIEHLPDTYLICFLNGFEEAKELMENARPLLKSYNLQVYQSLKEALRILRKVKYN